MEEKELSLEKRIERLEKIVELLWECKQDIRMETVDLKDWKMIVTWYVTYEQKLEELKNKF